MRRRHPFVLAAIVVAMTAAVTSGPAIAAPTATAPTATGQPALVHPADAPQTLAAAQRVVAEMTTAERAASIVMGHISSQNPAELSEYMEQAGIGGFILMGANVPGAEAELQRVSAALATDSSLPGPLIAIDQEGGIVSRLPWDQFPASVTLKDRPVAEVAASFAARGSLVARAGANVNFGIVADTTSERESFIFGRALGADPASAAERVTAAVTAEEQFAASTLKHFPGHGAAPGDSHELIPSTDKTLDEWRQSDAVPFIAGIDAGASLLMFGHLSYTAVDSAPASLSPRWHEIARDDLGFDGVIVTDDLGMLQSTGIPQYADPVANAVAAVAAGNDLVLSIAHTTPATASELTAGITTAVESGSLSAERLQDAADRVMTLRMELAASGAVWAPCADCEPAS